MSLINYFKFYTDINFISLIYALKFILFKQNNKNNKSN